MKSSVLVLLIALSFLTGCSTAKYPPVVEVFPPKERYPAKLRKEKETQEALSALTSGLGGFRDQNGRYPTREEGLRVLLQHSALWKTTYVRPEYLRDAWGNAIRYRLLKSPKDAVMVVSDGPDRLPETEDDLFTGTQRL